MSAALALAATQASAQIATEQTLDCTPGYVPSGEECVIPDGSMDTGSVIPPQDRPADPGEVVDRTGDLAPDGTAENFGVETPDMDDEYSIEDDTLVIDDEDAVEDAIPLVPNAGEADLTD
ncbi:hypothetical protein RM543_13860 [Roseicyclus sp. F158]|uniref:Porin n=1 Tax=Tropicimonas omnivorans TaxID=3075590 RepID=A0ABU3DJL2_9RHOB|nr:hypothetical protein [Roseicyclus sp. F158]MDT0683773.1 hypothetical protein [Roseicyclus sp. F158]